MARFRRYPKSKNAFLDSFSVYQQAPPEIHEERFYQLSTSGARPVIGKTGGERSNRLLG
jgi:hypothetical protein